VGIPNNLEDNKGMKLVDLLVTWWQRLTAKKLKGCNTTHKSSTGYHHCYTMMESR